jgi:hypothetical protein
MEEDKQMSMETLVIIDGNYLIILMNAFELLLDANDNHN